MFISCTQGGKDDLCLTLHTELETSLLKRLVDSWCSSRHPPHQEPGYLYSHSLVSYMTFVPIFTYTLATSPHTHYSVDCYMFAQAMLPSPAPPPSPSPPPIITGHQQRLLCDKLGNAWNELGVYYMHVAASLDFANGESCVSPAVTSSSSPLPLTCYLLSSLSHPLNHPHLAPPAFFSPSCSYLLCHVTIPPLFTLPPPPSPSLPLLTPSPLLLPSHPLRAQAG